MRRELPVPNVWARQVNCRMEAGTQQGGGALQEEEEKVTSGNLMRDA